MFSTSGELESMDYILARCDFPGREHLTNKLWRRQHEEDFAPNPQSTTSIGLQVEVFQILSIYSIFWTFESLSKVSKMTVKGLGGGPLRGMATLISPPVVPIGLLRLVFVLSNSQVDTRIEVFFWGNKQFVRCAEVTSTAIKRTIETIPMGNYKGPTSEEYKGCTV
jgi:hypothetical protein